MLGQGDNHYITETTKKSPSRHQIRTNAGEAAEAERGTYFYVVGGNVNKYNHYGISMKIPQRK